MIPAPKDSGHRLGKRGRALLYSGGVLVLILAGLAGTATYAAIHKARRSAGSWSGTQEGAFLSIRSGMGIQEAGGHRFLLVGYFTGATPSGMARVFQAYRCRYAIILDMNAPSQCYFALYRRDAHGAVVDAEYLHKDMASSSDAKGAYRFLQTNDARDFFYVLPSTPMRDPAKLVAHKP